MKYTALIFTLMMLNLPVQAAEQNPIFGVWETARVPDEGEVDIAHVKIEACKNNPRNLCGKVIWSEIEIDPETGKPPLDKFNPDESLRKRPVICMQTISDMEPTDDSKVFNGGSLYSARTGKTYSGSIELKDKDHLNLTGGVLFGLITRTVTWKRVKGAVKDPCK